MKTFNYSFNPSIQDSFSATKLNRGGFLFEKRVMGRYQDFSLYCSTNFLDCSLEYENNRIYFRARGAYMATVSITLQDKTSRNILPDIPNDRYLLPYIQGYYWQLLEDNRGATCLALLKLPILTSNNSPQRK